MERIYTRLRSYQRRTLEARQRGCKRFVEVLHRRAGKDRNWMSVTLTEMLRRRGVYLHFFPSLNQGRRDIWDNIIQDYYDGVEHSYNMVRAMFPEELLTKRPNETEMQIELLNGSIYQIMGADDKAAVERARGANPVGVILSEYAFMDCDPWPILAPVLAENNGWIAFISTSNVEDDNFHRIYKSAIGDPRWFSQLLTVNDTRRDAEGEDGSPVIPTEEIDDMRRRNITEEEIQREYYCSFRGYEHGTIYGDLIRKADEERRLGRFPYVPTQPVGVLFDLGHSDQMVMLFYQMHGRAVHFIDFWEDRLKDIRDAARILREDKQYVYGRIVLPWDGWSAANYLEEVGFRNVVVCRRARTEGGGDEIVSLQAQIDEVRRAFSLFYFDNELCSKAINHLRKYARKYDRDKLVFMKQPIHNEHSHTADALRTGVSGGFGPMLYEKDLTPVKVESTFDPREW